MPFMKLITLYKFDELNDKAKEVARQWFKGGVHFDQNYSATYEDAKQIGFDITEWQMDSASFVRNFEGEFTVSATECMELILKNHGKDCGSYKIALKMSDAIDALPELPSEKATNYHEIERLICETVDALESDFLIALEQEYKHMLQTEIDELYSDDYAEETIRANDYTFRENGKRED